jgi:hypothetical protein
MLTIKNVRKDIGHDTGFQFGAYTLIDGGLSNEGSPSILENPYYTFYWAFGGGLYANRSVKVVIDREPISDELPNRYRFRFFKRKDGPIITPASIHRGWGEILSGWIDKKDLRDSNKFYMEMITIMERLKSEWYVEDIK